MKLNSILENIIRKSGGLKPPKLGKVELLWLSKEDKHQLLADLKTEYKFSKRIIITMIVFCCILFALTFFFVIYYRDSPMAISAILTVSGLSFTGILTIMRRILIDKTKMDLIMITIPNLSPEQAMVFIQTIYVDKNRIDE